MSELLGVQSLAHQYVLPMRVLQTGRQRGCLPLQDGFLCAAKPLVLSALKQSESGTSVVARLWNADTLETMCRVKLGFAVQRVWKVTLEEDRLQELSVNAANEISFPARAGEIVTLEIQPRRSGRAAAPTVV
jgi:alpha-mannosidase